jgi:hypothetical protein
MFFPKASSPQQDVHDSNTEGLGPMDHEAQESSLSELNSAPSTTELKIVKSSQTGHYYINPNPQ